MEIDISEMEERDKRFWKSRAGERQKRRVKSFHPEMEGKELKEKVKEVWEPEWWANIKKNGELGRTTYSDLPGQAVEQERQDQVGHAHWHSTKDKGKASEGDKMAMVLRVSNRPEKHQIFCVHGEEETSCYDLRGFKDSWDQLESESARNMWDEAVDKGIIDVKSKERGEISFDE